MYRHARSRQVEKHTTATCTNRRSRSRMSQTNTDPECDVCANPHDTENALSALMSVLGEWTCGDIANDAPETRLEQDLAANMLAVNPTFEDITAVLDEWVIGQDESVGLSTYHNRTLHTPRTYRLIQKSPETQSIPSISSCSEFNSHDMSPSMSTSPTRSPLTSPLQKTASSPPHSPPLPNSASMQRLPCKATPDNYRTRVLWVGHVMLLLAATMRVFTIRDPYEALALCLGNVFVVSFAGNSAAACVSAFVVGIVSFSCASTDGM